VARSHCIYIAYDTKMDTLLVTATVKHEIITYLNRHFPTFIEYGEIRRYGDCRGSEHTLLDLEKEL